MKTTLDLNDELLAEAKRRAAAQGTTLKAFVEAALRSMMLPRAETKDEYELELPVVRDVTPPAIDIADRDRLYDFMGDRD